MVLKKWYMKIGKVSRKFLDYLKEICAGLCGYRRLSYTDMNIVTDWINKEDYLLVIENVLRRASDESWMFLICS